MGSSEAAELQDLTPRLEKASELPTRLEKVSDLTTRLEKAPDLTTRLEKAPEAALWDGSQLREDNNHGQQLQSNGSTNIKLNGQRLKEVDNFQSLGSTLSKDGSSTKEIKTRPGLTTSRTGPASTQLPYCA